MTHIVKTSRPIWIRRLPVAVAVPAQRRGTAVEQHPDYFPVLTALNKRGVNGEIVSITSHKPECDEWCEIYAIELGFYWYERRTVFALVRFGG